MNQNLKYAFIFPGQGSQKLGMLDSFLSSPVAQQLIEQASSVIGLDIKELCKNGPNDKLTDTENAQPIILATSYIAYKIFKQSHPHINPGYLAGHSLGEYSALLAGDAFKFEDVLQIVKLRGKHMQSSFPKGQGAMGSLIGVNEKEAIELCKQAAQGEVLMPANYNCPGQIVVSGTKKAVERLSKISRLIMLPVSAPFHCPLIKDAEIKMREVLNNFNIQDSKIPVVINVDNSLVTSSKLIKESLLKQITAPVLWQSGIEKMIKLGVNCFIEFGNGKVLTNMLKRIDSSVQAFAFNSAELII